MIPPGGEAEIVHAAVPDGASILELGCGTGRILKPLAGLGHRVHGVDDSPGMLAHLAGLPVTRSAIELLALAERFDVVLLASTLLNADQELRQKFLATCRNHVASDGLVVFQYQTPDWFDTFPDSPREREAGGITIVIRSCERLPDGITCELEYQAAGQSWTHSWTSYQISDEQLMADLAGAGLAFDRWLTDDHGWFTARPTISGSVGQAGEPDGLTGKGRDASGPRLLASHTR